MTTRKKILVCGLFSFILFIAFLSYRIYEFSSVLSKFGECGGSTGPIYEQKSTILLDSTNIDLYLTIPNGRLAISNTLVDSNSIDTIPPILIRVDNSQNIIWAIKLNSNLDSSKVPLFKMDNIKLVEDKAGKRISFFNSSYGEPGTIYLTENYDFDFLYLSPM